MNEGNEPSVADKLLGRLTSEIKAAVKKTEDSAERRRLQHAMVERVRIRRAAVRREQREKPKHAKVRLLREQARTGALANKGTLGLDIWKTPSTFLAVEPRFGGYMEDGDWAPLRYVPLSEMKGTLNGTIAGLTEWFNAYRDVVLAVRKEAGAAVSVEMIVSNLGRAWDVLPQYLRGVTDVENEVLKAVLPTATSVVVGMNLDDDNASQSAAARRGAIRLAGRELAGDVVDAAENVAEQIAEHVSLPAAVREELAHTHDWAKEHFEFRLEIYGTSEVGLLDDGRPRQQHTWELDGQPVQVLKYEVAPKETEEVRCFFLPVTELRDYVLDYAIPAIFKTLQDAKLIV